MPGIGRVAAIAMATVALALSACAADESDQTAETEAAASGDRALLDAAQRPLDRARGVEDIAAGRKGDLDEDIERSEQ
jgi:hypothetical protein